MKRSLFALGCVFAVGCNQPEPRYGVDNQARIDANHCGPGVGSVAFPSYACSTAGAPDTLALGVCGNLQADNTLTVDSAHGGSLLAVNGSTTIASPMNVQGSMVSYGTIDARNTLHVSSNVSTAGDWLVSSPAQTNGDAFIGGMVDARNTVKVDGTLHVNVSAAAEGVTAGAVSVEPVAVAKPLDCSRAPRARDLVDSLTRDRTGWSEVFFGRESASKVTVPSEITLGCGRYYFAPLEVDNTLAIHVVGDVVMVVDGDLRIASPTVIDLAAGARLTLVVRDSLQVDNTLSIADGTDPAATWVAVGGTLRVASPLRMNGALVMPDGDLAGDNTFDLEGSALVGSLRVAAPMVVHSDAPRGELACVP